MAPHTSFTLQKRSWVHPDIGAQTVLNKDLGQTPAPKGMAPTQRMAQLSGIANGPTAPIQRQSAPQGGLPSNLKSGIESLSGIAMDDVRVHYNSSKPAQLQAHAFAQGKDIHLAPGQEKHLPHEAWHVVQQKQGRVKPTLQLKGVAINDDGGLEREADEMGGRAMGGTQSGDATHNISVPMQIGNLKSSHAFPLQLKGSGPFKRDLTLQTSYISLTAKHPNVKVEEDETGDYVIKSFKATARPPAYLGGEKLKVQGQHKVAWRAIWGSLERCVNLKVGKALEAMQEIIDIHGQNLEDDLPLIHVGENVNSPKELDSLVKKGHNYLVSRQYDDPAWLPIGTKEEQRKQLQGKGEKGLGEALGEWQAANPDYINQQELIEWLNSSVMNKLFDSSGRKDGELADMQARAKLELRIHNPKLYQAFKSEIDQWVENQ